MQTLHCILYVPPTLHAIAKPWGPEVGLPIAEFPVPKKVSRLTTLGSHKAKRVKQLPIAIPGDPKTPL